MAGKIPEQFIQDLLARTDLVDLIDARVPLKRSGSNHMARCPFHNEKSPSFSVSRDKQFYYCFGCGAKGNAIGFLMEFDRLSFPEAIEALAENLGLDVPHEAGEVSSQKGKVGSVQPVYELLDQASRFYQNQLRQHPTAGKAVEYLRQRGVSGEIARTYRLGYAPPGYRNLPQEWSQDLLSAAGLLSLRGRDAFDWFRNRILFPIRDRRGRTIGFGGRIIDEGTPKYLNSPETDVFKKHREVYGLYELLAAVRKPQDIIVVEGYMDVIALAQYGITNAVATLGTATSTEQIALLFRYASRIVFCFDGDAAGQGAAWKALESSLPHLREGRQLGFLQLPDGQDPDSMVREEGVEAFRMRIQSAQAFSDYFFLHLTDRLDLSTIEGRASLVDKARPLIQRLPDGVFREMIEERLASLSQHAEPEPTPYRPAGSSQGGQSSRPAEGRPSALRTFLALLVQNPELVERMDTTQMERLASMGNQGPLIHQVIEILLEYPDITTGGLLEKFRDHPGANIIGRLITWEHEIAADDIPARFEEYLRLLTVDQWRVRRLDNLIKQSRQGRLSVSEQEELRQLTFEQTGNPGEGNET